MIHQSLNHVTFFLVKRIIIIIFSEMSVQRVSVIRVNPNRSSTIRAHPYKPNQIEIQSAPPSSNGSNNNWNRQTFQVQESANRSSIPVRRSPILVQQVRVTPRKSLQSATISNQSVIMQHQNPIDIAIKQEIESCNNNQTTEMVKNIQVFNQIQSTTSKKPMNRGSISPSSFMKSRDDSDFEANHLKSNFLTLNKLSDFYISRKGTDTKIV